MDSDYRSLAPSIGDEKFHWSLPVEIDPSDVQGSVDRNILELENVYQEVCCRKALYWGDNVHIHASMIHQALYVLKEIQSACVAK